MKYQEIEYKSILNKQKYIDTWFWCRYTMNPYRGCEHRCLYCDARQPKYNVENFEYQVGIKAGADIFLDNKITKARTLLPDVIAFGGVCDAYQPIEQKYKLARKILKVLIKHHYPCFMLTKSDSILRDVDLYNEISTNSYACIAFTINTTDDESAKFFEPYATTPTKRFEALSKLKSTGLYVGICAMPLLPYIWDTEDKLDTLFKKAKEAGADFIIPASCTLGESMKPDFYSALDRYQSGLSDKYRKIFIAGSYGPKPSYTANLNKKLLALSQKYNIPLRIKKHFVPDDYRKNNYRLGHYLANIAFSRQIENKSFSSYQWAAMNIMNIKEDVINLLNENDLKKIRNFENYEIYEIAKKFLLRID